MRKLLFALFSVALLFGLSGCGLLDGLANGDSGEKKVESVTGSAKDKETDEEVPEEEPEKEADSDEKQDFDLEIVDNDVVRATLVSIEHLYDELLDEESIEVTFEIENKLDDTFVVQAREVSADGKMVNDSMVFMSQEISGGKYAEAVLAIADYSGGELPKLEEDLELTLHIFSWDDYDFEHDVDVKIEF